MKASLAVCILPALLAVGSCLQCEVCSGLGNSCTGSMQTCAAGEDSCRIALEVASVAGTKIQTISKGCVKSSECKTGPDSLNFGTGMTIRMNTACCVGEACNTTTVTVPPADAKPNGWRCPGCYTSPSEQCLEETVYCTGAETQCIDITQTVKDGGNPGRVVMKGCTSEFNCALLKKGSSFFGKTSANLTRTQCRVASGAGDVDPEAAGLLLPALAGLLLLKLLS
ncbi:phospholipase A2 inhibitor and Ly6/PLAUR domain-containing protein-like [Emydura macquarii macquarii]|uniref:phospholipase A2 inhibitor and Ly6/PLAUR domain-containing protein-like n=1 Tax=Emydura macquarii macquarii TaxID=1129001 RepID=UPI003529F654